MLLLSASYCTEQQHFYDTTSRRSARLRSIFCIMCRRAKPSKKPLRVEQPLPRDSATPAKPITIMASSTFSGGGGLPLHVNSMPVCRLAAYSNVDAQKILSHLFFISSSRPSFCPLPMSLARKQRSTNGHQVSSTTARRCMGATARRANQVGGKSGGGVGPGHGYTTC